MMTPHSQGIHDLQRENRLLKKKLQTQTDLFKEERSRLLTHRDSIQSLLNQEHHQHQQIASEFDRRMAHLECELRQIQSVPHSHITRSPHFSGVSFSVLEMEANRLQEETDRICGTFHPTSELEFSPRRSLRFPFDRPKDPISPNAIPDRPPSPPAQIESQPVPSDKPTKVTPKLQEIPDQFSFPDLGEDLFLPVSPKEEPAAAPAPPPPSSRKAPQKSSFVAQPISQELSLNDDFFDNAAPSPVPEPLKQQSPPNSSASIQKKSSESPAVKPTKLKQNPRPIIRRQSSESSDSFGPMDVSFDLPSNEPPPKPKKAEPPKKKSDSIPQKKPPPVKEKNSAETFEIDPDQIKFDFNGMDPFG
jgi:hypothetical protein